MAVTVPKTRQLDDLRSLARGRLGLVIGSGATMSDPAALQTVASEIASKFGVDPGGSYLDVGTRAGARGASLEDVRAALIASVEQQKAAAGLSPLAKVAWSGVISATPDGFFESNLQSERQWRAARRDISVLTDPNATPRDRTTPVFKVLGSIAHGDPIVTRSDYLLAKARWERVARQFLESVRASPVLLVGLSATPWILEDLLPHLFAHGGQRPGALVLVDGDPILENELLHSLVPKDILHVANGTVSSVARALAPAASNQQLSLETKSDESGEVASVFADFDDLVVYVNATLKNAVGIEQRERLLDYLFLPDLPSWDPFVHDLDFERSISAEITNELHRFRSEVEADAFFELRGAAAIGKTTLLKRVSLELAKAGAHVLWIRDYQYSDSAIRLKELFRKVAARESEEPLYLFLDTPVATRELSPATLLEFARGAGLRLVLVSSARLSEAANSPSLLPDVAGNVWTLDDALDPQEWDRLPSYLLKLGLRATLPEANADVAQAQRRAARDTLAILYFLLPQTRQAIRKSVAQEYIALGNSEGLRDLLRDRLDASPDVLKQAYALVAVSNHHGVPLPIEILVASLGINYSDWLHTIASQNGPAFGFLYADDDFDPESASYRTRNDVVTSIIVEIVNGGTLSRQAEASTLQRILSSCSSTSPVYSRYCTHILTPWKKFEDAFDFPTGLLLYDAAIDALPFAHRTILHHKAIWQRKVGERPSDAVETLNAALDAPRQLPNGETTDADEHIRTSKAAAIIDQVRRGEVEKGRGRQAALKELERARSTTFMNPNAVHVYAHLVSRMLKQDPNAPSTDKMIAASQAIAEVDRTILLLRSSRLKRWVASYNSDLLHEVRREILSNWATVNDLEGDALDAWNQHQAQEGFALATRRRYASAIDKRNQGTVFKEAFEYWNSCVRRVESKTKVSAELAEAGATLYYAWQVRPRSRETKPTSVPIDWSLLEGMSRIALGSARFQRDLFYRYLYGLALAHLGKWEDCHAVFAENRRSTVRKEFLHTTQDYLLDSGGLKRRLQGRLNTAQRSFFFADELKRDFIASTKDQWPSGQQILHSHVVFSFAGPLASLEENACGLDI